jgi:hypothetical protein
MTKFNKFRVKKEVRPCPIVLLGFVVLQSVDSLLCRFCLWCASLLEVAERVGKCPACGKDEIAKIAIAAT